MTTTFAKVCQIIAVLTLTILFMTAFYFNFHEESEALIRDLQQGELTKAANTCTHHNNDNINPIYNTPRIPNMKDSLTFLRPDMSVECEDIFTQGGSKEEIKDILDELMLHQKRLSEEGLKLKAEGKEVLAEGYCSQNVEETYIMVKLASLSWVKTVCETGFNTGHSAMIWLTANPQANVYSFDINRYTLTEIMAKHVKKRFPDRFHITFGDSTKTLPEFRRQNPDIQCDLCITDGGHTVPIAKSDLESFYSMSSPKNIAFFDNHPDNIHIGAPWESLKRRGKLTEYFRCRYAGGNRYGFTFGQYIH